MVKLFGKIPLPQFGACVNEKQDIILSMLRTRDALMVDFATPLAISHPRGVEPALGAHLPASVATHVAKL